MATYSCHISCLKQVVLGAPDENLIMTSSVRYFTVRLPLVTYQQAAVVHVHFTLKLLFILVWVCGILEYGILSMDGKRYSITV